MALRSVADVILVGAGTARDEQYKPPTAREASLPYRRDRGQAPRPALAVVTRSGKLSTELPMFNDPDLPPLVICGTAAEQDALKELEGVADIAQVPTESVSPDQALEVLHQRGHQLVLLEGGPSLNGTFTEADLIDEWNLTLSPLLVGGTSGRATKSHNASKREFSPSHVWSAEGLLFLQWLRSSEPAQN